MIKLLKNKKGLTLKTDWAEIFSIIILFFGIIISLFVDSAVVAYIVFLGCGFIIGKLYLTRKILRGFTFFLLTIAFYIGFIIGIYLRDRGNIIILSLLFLIGIYFGYKLHKNRFFL
jgi:hypothetical protein